MKVSPQIWGRSFIKYILSVEQIAYSIVVLQLRVGRIGSIMRKTTSRSSVSAVLSRRPLTFQLTLLVLVTALPLMLLSFIMYNRLVANARENIRQGLLVSARTLAGLVDNEIDTHTAVASTLAQSPALLRGDLETFWHEAKRALELVPTSWLLVSTPNGQIELATLVPFGTSLPRHAAPDIINRAFLEGRPQVSDLVIGSVALRWIGYVQIPVFRDGAPLYSLSIVLAPDRFLALMQNHFTRGEIVAVLDRNKKFVTRIPDHEARVGTRASDGWRAAMARQPEGWTDNKNLEGEWSVTGYAQTSHGWTAGVALLESAISGPLDTILWSSALTAGALTMLGLILAVFTARHACRGMTALENAVQDLGEGRLFTEPPAPFAEAKTIAKTLTVVSAELNRRDEAIKRHRVELESKVTRRTQELVSEIKRRQETETTLRQSQKMDSIGQLTGGIAHDFNNMLTIILGNLELIQRRLRSLGQSTDLDQSVESALQGARNAAKLTHRLLAFARQQPLEPSVLDINAKVSDLLDLMARTVGENIKVVPIFAEGLWPTFADSNQVENCLINLVINARDAMPSGGNLIIETANVFLDEIYAARFGDLVAGQFVMLSIRDTGAGITPKILERVFEPFFTTKAHGKGTGLGLAMVHGFVKQSGGHVLIDSEVGKGTAVKIYLPKLATGIRNRHVPQPIDIDAQPLRAIQGETILLVEDDAGVREYAIDALGELGYEVLVAVDAAEALRIFAKSPRVDLLFSDIVLGGNMTGRHLAERLLKLRPSLPVVLTTGYSCDAAIQQNVSFNLLNKPYSQRDLAEKIASAIENSNKRMSATAA